MNIAIDLDKTIIDCDSVIFKVACLFAGKQKLKTHLRFTQIYNPHKRVKPSRLIYFLNADNHYVVEDSISYLTKWHEMGAELFVLSSRPNWKMIRNLTYENMENTGLGDIANVVINCSNKAAYCFSHNIDVLIDDSPDICKNAQLLGVKAICFNKKSNGQKNSQEGRIRHWKDLDNIICNMMQASEEGREPQQD